MLPPVDLRRVRCGTATGTRAQRGRCAHSDSRSSVRVQVLPMSSRLRFVLSQLGPKPQGVETRLRLIDVLDLPGTGWKVVDQRIWRTGHQKPNEPWAQRAAASGSVTAWRSFRASDRWLWTQLVPLASAADSQAALRAVPAGALKNRRAMVVVESESEAPGIAVEGADATWAYEQRTSGHHAAGTTLLLAWTVEAHLVVSAASGRPDWRWDELAAIAAKQRERLTA